MFTGDKVSKQGQRFLDKVNSTFYPIKQIGGSSIALNLK
jgi:hypothetical protein